MQTSVVITMRVLENITDNLKDNMDATVSKSLLGCLYRLLVDGQAIQNDKQLSENPVIAKFLSFNGEQVLENMQRHPDDKIYDLAQDIIKKFFMDANWFFFFNCIIFWTSDADNIWNISE